MGQLFGRKFLMGFVQPLLTILSYRCVLVYSLALSRMNTATGSPTDSDAFHQGLESVGKYGAMYFVAIIPVSNGIDFLHIIPLVDIISAGCLVSDSSRGWLYMNLDADNKIAHR